MALNALRKKNQLLLAKIESTYDTDSAPAASTDSMLAIDPKIKEIVDPVRRPAQIGSLSRLGAVPGSKYAEITFSMELKGSGVAGTAPRIGALLRACGMGNVVVSSVSNTYSPESAGFESVTIWLYIDGRVHKVTGCRGDWKLKCEAGQMAMMEFTFKGRYADPTLLALASPTLESTTPAVCKSSVFTYNSRTSLVVKTAELEMNNTVAMRPSLNDANAIAGFEITARDPMLTVDPECTIETSYDFRGDALSGNLRQVSWQVGATAGNICTITIPKWCPEWPEYEDRDEILVEKIKGGCAQNSGNDEITLAFT